MKTWLLNIFSDIAIVLGSYLFYTRIPYFRRYFSEDHYLYYHFTSLDVFFWIAVLIIIIIIPVRIFGSKDQPGKSLLIFWSFWRLLSNALNIKFTFRVSRAEKNAILATLVKFFWLPLMLAWLVDNFTDLLRNFLNFLLHKGLYQQNFEKFFQNYFFWLCLSLILFVDVAIFCFGYLVESRYLKNTIRSVEPTIFGWAVALACYPPFNAALGYVFPWKPSDSVNFFSNFKINFILNILIIVAMAIYAWASVALGFKASNLTNRGIIGSGPYKYVRHPAYVAKNFAWWVGATPAFMIAWQNQGVAQALFVVAMLAVWSLIYFFRAITEERHLLQDPDYRLYCRKVKWRFIPGVL